MGKITTISDGASSPETTSLPASPQRSRASSTASTQGRAHLQTTVSIEPDDLFERLSSASSPRASSGSASSSRGVRSSRSASASRSASPVTRSPSPTAPTATDSAPGAHQDATRPRLSAEEKGKGRAIDAPQALEAPQDVPEVERPEAAGSSKLEELVDGLNEKLVGAWHAAVAVLSYVMTTLSALWATVSQKVSTGYQAAKDGWNRAKGASYSFATAQLRRLQNYATADVDAPTGAYGRAKAATKRRVHATCAYLLNKLQGASVAPADDAKPDAGVNVEGADNKAAPTPSEQATTVAG